MKQSFGFGHLDLVAIDRQSASFASLRISSLNFRLNLKIAQQAASGSGHISPTPFLRDGPRRLTEVRLPEKATPRL
jgi:hypothetical protein